MNYLNNFHQKMIYDYNFLPKMNYLYLYPLKMKQLPSKGKIPEQLYSKAAPSEQFPSKDEQSKQLHSKDERSKRLPSKNEQSKRLPSVNEQFKHPPSKEEPSGQLPSKDELSERLSSKIELYSERFTSKEELSERFLSKDDLYEGLPSKQVLSEQLPSKDSLSELLPFKDELSGRLPSKNEFSKRLPSKDKLSEQHTSKNEFPEQYSLKDELPKLLYSKDEPSKQLSLKDELAEQLSFKDELAKQLSSKDELLKQLSSKDEPHKQLCFKDKLPKQLSSKDEIPEIGEKQYHLKPIETDEYSEDGAKSVKMIVHTGHSDGPSIVASFDDKVEVKNINEDGYPLINDSYSCSPPFPDSKLDETEHSMGSPGTPLMDEQPYSPCLILPDFCSSDKDISNYDTKCYKRSKVRRASIGVQCRRDKTIQKYLNGSVSDVRMCLNGPKLDFQSKHYVLPRPLPYSQSGHEQLKYSRFIRIETYPNGGASIVHMYQDEIDVLSKEEMEELAEEFFKPLQAVSPVADTSDVNQVESQDANCYTNTSDKKGSEPTFTWRESGKPFWEKLPPSSPERDSNLDLHVLGSLAQHNTSALANHVTEAGPYLL
ncbi:unnamed protein product [Timema podura]|uniref:Uncharacterized protein n=1 Tax=Timema podura TaxID=61482 RepID=A0ABN7NIF5_TIMPD|nr:unnamed protein product [Timema podura]